MKRTTIRVGMEDKALRPFRRKAAEEQRTLHSVLRWVLCQASERLAAEQAAQNGSKRQETAI